MRKSLDLGKMTVRNLLLFVCLLTGSIAIYAQPSNLHIYDDGLETDTSEQSFYEDINNYDIFVEPYDKVIYIDTTFDEFGLKHAYFLRGLIYAAIPKRKDGNAERELVLNRVVYWYKLPVEGKNPTYFNKIRQVIFPFSAKYHSSDKTESIFNDFLKSNFTTDLERIAKQLSRIDGDSYLIKKTPLNKEKSESPIYYQDEVGDVPHEEFRKANLPYTKDKYKKNYFDSLQTHKNSIATFVKDNYYVVPPYTLSLIDEFFVHSEYWPYFQDECNFMLSSTSSSNKDYTMLNDSLICMFHNCYYFYYEPGAFYYDTEGEEFLSLSEGGIDNKLNYLDSLLLITDKGVLNLRIADYLQNASDTIVLVHKNGVVIKLHEGSFIASTDRDTILRYLKPNTLLYDYYKEKKYDSQQITINSPLTHSFYSICHSLEFGPIVSWFDNPSLYEVEDNRYSSIWLRRDYANAYDSYYDTLLLSEKQQSQIRKEYLKLAKLDAQLQQIEIQSETYCKLRDRDSDEYFFDSKRHLYSYDEKNETMVVSPKYRKKVEKIEKEKEKISNKLKKMGIRMTPIFSIM